MPNNKPPPHSDVLRKADTRKFILEDIADVNQERPHTTVIMLFDDILEGRLLSEDILERFGASNVLILSPNIHHQVTDLLMQLLPKGMVWGGTGCYHAFLDYWRSAIAALGGIQVVMADCHRSFRFGAQLLLQQLGQERLYFPSPRASAPSTSYRTRIVIVCSLLYDQIHHSRKQAGAIEEIKAELLRMSHASSSCYVYTVQRVFQS